MTKKKFFITGTDTNVGKTLLTCVIMQTISYFFPTKKVVGYKPIATGCMIRKSGYIYSEDVMSILSASNVVLSHKDINPISLLLPTSPNIASKKENISIRIDELSKGLRNLELYSDFIIIEGIGGWLTPINEFNHTLEDWIISEKNISVILVVGIKLGCINHTLLTIRSIQKSGVKLTGWIANHISYKDQNQDLVDSLKEIIHFPMIGEIPWIHKKEIILKNLIKYIDSSIFL